jgi:hypothetical protein
MCATDSGVHHRMIRSVPLVSIKIEHTTIKWPTRLWHRAVRVGKASIFIKISLLGYGPRTLLLNYELRVCCWLDLVFLLFAGSGRFWWLDLVDTIGWIWNLLLLYSDVAGDYLGICRWIYWKILDLQVSDPTPVWCAQHFPEFVANKA